MQIIILISNRRTDLWAKKQLTALPAYRLKDGGVAMAIINLVAQTITQMGISAAQAEEITDIVLTGKLAIFPLIRDVMDGVSQLYNMNFLVPGYAEFGKAVGAAIKAAESN